MIHFSSCTDFDETDSLHKLRFFFDYISEKFLNNYTLSQNVAIDEYLSLWKSIILRLTSEKVILQNVYSTEAKAIRHQAIHAL